MLIGIVGAPNKGKSTLFSALTLNDVAIADYPFTTIDPNLGITYATRACPCKSMQERCNARNSLCIDGIRKIPVNVIDVAGLVEGAHMGKGMGNKFLNDLASADALVIVADASGGTDSLGLKREGSDPTNDIKMIDGELTAWLVSVIKRHMSTISRSDNAIDALSEILAGMKIRKEDITSAVDSNALTTKKIKWSDSEIVALSRSLMKISKPYLIAANKMDMHQSPIFAKKLEEEYGKERVVEISAAIELALEKAEHKGAIRWIDANKFDIIGKDISNEQKAALEYMKKFVSENGRGSRLLINRVVFGLLDNIVVYPVEDEHKYTDSSGNVLPDVILMKRGSTAHDLAMKIHTEIGDRMLYAIDAKKKIRIAKDHVLEDNSIIKIVSSAKR